MGCAIFILKVSIKIFVAHSMLLFCLTACFSPHAFNILRIFPKTFGSWNKTFLVFSSNSVAAISVFQHTAMINAVHV